MMTTQQQADFQQPSAALDHARLHAVLAEARRQRGLVFAQMMTAALRALVWPFRKLRPSRRAHQTGLPHSA